MDRTWIFPTALVCSFGFFKEMKPSEPFLTPYLNSSYKNLTLKELSDEVYPVSTYASLVSLFLVLLLADVSRYKPLIIIEALAYLATRILLIWGEGVSAMQIMQITYGLASATEIAYYSYVYAVVSEAHYQKVSSYTRGAVLFGQAIAGILGQILISTHATNYLVLNYISLASVIVAVLVSLVLPKVSGDIFLPGTFAYERLEGSKPSQSIPPTAELKRYDRGLFMTMKLLFQSFKLSYKNRHLRLWSLWWALAMCGCLQVENYVMNLWVVIAGEHTKDVYNGAVFAAGTLLSAFVAFLFSFVKADWGVFAEVLIGLMSLLDGALLVIMSSAHQVWVAYVTYIAFRAVYTFVITLASYQIALRVELSGFGLVFGFNTFVALCVQTILTLVVADKMGLDMKERPQFLVYGGYFGAIGAVFLFKPLLNACGVRWRAVVQGNSGLSENSLTSKRESGERDSPVNEDLPRVV